MRERAYEFREWGRNLANWLRRQRLVVIAYTAGGALMAHVGAFGTESVPATIRFGYFIGLCLAGGVFTAAVAAALQRRHWFAPRPMARMAVQAVAATILMTPLVWVAAAWLLNGDASPFRMLDLARQVAPTMALFAPVTLLMPHPPTEPGSRPDPLQWALPAGLRTAAIHAVEGHDHYVRVHTDRGSALVLLRLSDAVVRLWDVEGARTHRCWWVARGAVQGARRGRGRAVLSLPGGLNVPVSRTYAPALRGAGWF